MKGVLCYLQAKGDPSSQTQMTEKKQPAGVDIRARGLHQSAIAPVSLAAYT